MKLTEWLLGSQPQVLELKKTEQINARINLPSAPVLNTSAESLGRYATRSELVYSCIEKKAQTACDPVLTVQRKTSKGEWEDIPGHRALQVLLRPNPYDDGESFLRTWIASENIAGIFYAEIVRNGAGEPINLYPLRPDWMYPQYISTNKGHVLDYYAYRCNGIEVRYKPKDLLIHRIHGLGSMFSGQSPLSVALATIDADISATEYVRDFYNNDGTPAGILKLTGRNLSDDEASRLKQKWMSQYSRGGKTRGGIAILDDSADYEPIGARLSELDNEALTSINETRICMAFGVPPVLIGAYVGLKNVNQKASFKGAMEEFWMNTMSPELKSIRSFLTQKFLIYFEDEATIQNGQVRFFWNMSEVAAMQEDVDALHDRITLGYKSGIYKLDEARSKVGLDPIGPEAGGDEFFRPSTTMQQAMDRPETADQEDPKQLKGDILDAEMLEKKTANFELSREMSDAERLIDIKAIFDSYESNTAALTKALMQLRSSLIRQAVTEISTVSNADLHLFVLSPPKNAEKLVRPPIAKAIADGRSQIARDAKKSLQTKNDLDDFLQRILDLTISRVVNEVSTAVINIIAAFGLLDEDREAIEDQMLEELEARSDKPFELYARQAVNTAVNVGRREEMRQRADEIRLYEYSAILDQNVCDPCEEWDGRQANDLEELPETPNSECEGGANCRCFIVSIFDTEIE